MAASPQDTVCDIASFTVEWPSFIRFANPDPEVAVNARRAYLFADVFPVVDEESLNRLSVASELFETLICEIDAVLDGDRPAALNLMDLTAIQFEAYRIFAGIFPGHSPMWGEMRRALMAYTEMIGRQREYAAGRRDLLALTYADAVRLAHGKTSLGKVVPLALGELAGQPDVAARVAGSFDRLVTAKCFMDDIRDWRRDAELGQPSFLVALAGTAAGVAGRPAAGWSMPELDRIGHGVYFQGCAGEVVKAASALVEESRRLVDGLPADTWRAHIDTAESLVRGFAANLAAPVEDSGGPARPGPGGRVSARQTVRLRVEPGRPWHALARSALTGLLGQWRLSFPDIVPVRRLTSGTVHGQVGCDVLARAIVANAMAACDPGLAAGQLRAFVKRDVDYVLFGGVAALNSEGAAQSRGSRPYEVDELAEIARLLTGPGSDAASGPYLAAAARAAASVDPDPDPDLLANLLTVGPVPDDTAEAGLQRVLRAQEADGSWPSRSYCGSLYSTYQCMAALARLRPGLPGPLDRARDFILSGQNADGGWANDASIDSDALGTAVALLALAESQRISRKPAAATPAGPALTWLTAHAESDGAYPSVPFLVLAPGDVGVHGATAFGARSVTTALALRAALAWDELR
jgi:hypothetical protein